MTDSISEKLSSLKAQAVALESGLDNGLRLLAGKNDPESVNARLGLLIGAERFQDALDVVEERKLEEKWAAKAVFLYAVTGKYGDALSAVNRMSLTANATTLLRCKTFFAEGAVMRISKHHRKNSFVTPSEIADDDKAGLLKVVELLSPVAFALPLSEENVSALQARAVALLMQAHLFLGDLDQLGELGRVLESRKPASLELARFAVIGTYKVAKNFPERLRVDHPKSFDAWLLAIMIEHGLFQRYDDALNHAIALNSFPINLEDKERLAETLLAIAISSTAENLRKAKASVAEMLPQNGEILKHFDIVELVKSSKLEEAVKELECSKSNDYRWYQVAAYVYQESGDETKAAECLAELSNSVTHPQLLSQLSQISLASEQYRFASESLRKLVDLNPRDKAALWNLAMVSSLQGDFTTAIKSYTTLCELAPGNVDYSVRLASTLLQSGQFEKSIMKFEEVISSPKAPIDGVLGYAYAQKVAGNLSRAYVVLDKFKDRFWDDPRFLIAFMNVCYAAGHDYEAHMVLTRLTKLQENGEIEEILTAVSLDDVKALIGEQTKQEEEVQERLIKGQIPWLMADAMARRPAYRGWWVRTQELRWESDHPLGKAAYSIYSSNHYHVFDDKDSTSELAAITLPPSGSRIVLDLSALITLHRLDLLDEVLTYFSEVNIPSQYAALLQEEQIQLSPHQVSRHKVINLMKELIDRKDITVGSGAESKPDLRFGFVSERGAVLDKNVIELPSIIKVLHDAGKLAEQKFQSLKQQYGEPKESPSDLTGGASILVDDYALGRLIDSDILTDAMEVFDLVLEEDASTRIVNDFESVSLQDRLLQWQRDLIEIVRSGKLKSISLPLSNKKDKLHRLNEELPTLALSISQKEYLPLMVDDRCLQALKLNESGRMSGQAFGTDTFLTQQCKDNPLSLEKYSSAYLQLMKWRYRFLLPPIEVLSHLALNFRASPPGKHLHLVSKYLHSSMRDDGLFSGAEKANPPVSMAFRYFQDSVRLVASFIGVIWKDDQFDAEAACQFTDWALRELLPPLPRVLGPNVRLAEFIPKTVLGQVLIELSFLQDEKRAALALRHVIDGLGITDDEYGKIALEVINVD